jgi:hypothetical protein
VLHYCAAEREGRGRGEMGEGLREAMGKAEEEGGGTGEGKEEKVSGGLNWSALETLGSMAHRRIPHIRS